MAFYQFHLLLRDVKTNAVKSKASSLEGVSSKNIMMLLDAWLADADSRVDLEYDGLYLPVILEIPDGGRKAQPCVIIADSACMSILKFLEGTRVAYLLNNAQALQAEAQQEDVSRHLIKLTSDQQAVMQLAFGAKPTTGIH